MVSREIYSTGLKKKVMCEVHDIIATKTKGGGSRYQVIGYYYNQFAQLNIISPILFDPSNVAELTSMNVGYSARASVRVFSWKSVDSFGCKKLRLLLAV